MAQWETMAQSDTTFEISRDVIDFGDRVVALRQIVVAECRRSHPLRPLGIALLLIAVAGLGYEALMGAGLPTLKAGGSSTLWLAFVLAGISVFAIVYQRRLLVIALADGSKIRLRGGSNEFQERVVACIADALKANTGETFSVAVDLRAQTIAGVPETIQEAEVPTAATSSSWPTQPHAQAHNRNGPPGYGSPGYGSPGYGPAENGAMPSRNSLDSRSGISPSRPSSGRMPDPNPASNGVFPVGAHPASPIPGSYSAPAADVNAVPSDAHQPGLRPQRDASNPLRDMETLLDFMRRSDIQHKSALLELLGVAQDYLQGGGTARDDAMAHWQSFSAYVHQYLASVDGLVPLTERAGRPFATH